MWHAGGMQPLLDTKRTTSPREFATFLRKQGKLYWWKPDRFWVLTDFELATQALKGTEFSADRSAYFMARLGGIGIERVMNFLGVVTKMMVTSDPPEHTARRRLAQFGIADNVLEAFRPTVERTVNELVEKAAGGDTLELISQIALPLPNIILADLFSIPAERRTDFYRWSNDMTQFFGGGSADVEGDAAKANAGAGNLREYFTELIAARRKAPSTDFLSNLLQHQQSLGLDDSELISQAVMMLVAGSITTTDQIANNMYGLLTEGPPLDTLRDPAKLDAALEEATRLDPAVNFVFRVAKKDVALGDQTVKAGQLLFVSAHAVNRDPAVFDEPNDFKLDRARNPHIGYGSGLHYCLGARLGRIQMSTLFGALLRRFPGLTLAKAPPVRKHESLGFSGFNALTLQIR